MILRRGKEKCYQINLELVFEVTYVSPSLSQLLKTENFEKRNVLYLSASPGPARILRPIPLETIVLSEIWLAERDNPSNCHEND